MIIASNSSLSPHSDLRLDRAHSFSSPLTALPHRPPIIFRFLSSTMDLWSSISVGGVPILSFLEKQEIAYEKEMLEKIHKAVVELAYEVIQLKGYTSWAIGYSVESLARSLLIDRSRIHPLSVLAKGLYGIDGWEVFLSPPAQLGRGGVMDVANVHMSDKEARRLRDSAQAILNIQCQLAI